MARAPQPIVDPARESAPVLRRIGFFVLLIGLPLGAYVSAAGLVIVAAIGLALVGAAAAFDGAARPVRESLTRLAASPSIVALVVLAGWALLSLLWAPAPRMSAARLLGTAAVVGVALLGYLALPDRMRSANLYLVPIGAGAAALATLALAFGLEPDGPLEGARRLERGLCVLVLYAWPAIAWLRSRRRDVEAIGLAVAVAVAAALGPDPLAAVAFAIGALAYLVTQISERLGTSLIGFLFAIVLLAAPAILVLGVPHLEAFDRLTAWMAIMESWRSAILDEPARLLTGHGFGAFRRGSVPPLVGSAFGAPALVLWYDLGLVGVAATAFALWSGLRSTIGRFGPLLPGLAAAFATGFTVALSGVDRGETWWVAALASVALAFVAAERGQFRTKRPKAVGLGRGEPA